MLEKTGMKDTTVVIDNTAEDLEPCVVVVS